MPRDITFPEVEPTWSADRMCVQFYALDGRVLINCLVTVEALHSHFGVRGPSAEECVAAFRANRVAIVEAARRKLLAGPPSQRGGEVLLLDADFPRRAGESTAPPERPESIKISIDPAGVDDPALRRAIDSASAILHSEFGRGAARVRADWRIVPSGGVSLAELRLTDQESGVVAWRLYERDDLDSAPSARFSIYRLWDDVLREKGRRYLHTFAAAAEPRL